MKAFLLVLLTVIVSSLSAEDYNCLNPDNSYVEAFLGDLSQEGRPGGLLSYFENPNSAPSEISGIIKETRTVEDFLANFDKFVGEDMADQFARNITIFDPSRSLQQGRRYLSSSPKGDVVFSFSHASGASAGESIEMLFYNAAKGEFELGEISFEGGQTQVERNPSKCFSCHGAPPNIKPMVESNLWPNAIPPAGAILDDITRNLLIETQREVNEASRNATRDRLDFLKPFFDQQKDFSDLSLFFPTLDAPMRIEGTELMTSSIGLLTSNLNSLNACRITKTLEDLPISEIIYTTLTECEQDSEKIENLVTDKDREDLLEFYCERNNRSPEYCGSFENLFSTMRDDFLERIRQNQLRKRERLAFVTSMRLPEEEREDFVKNSLQSLSDTIVAEKTDVDKRVWLQILSEPLGVDFNLLTATIDNSSQDLTGQSPSMPSILPFDARKLQMEVEQVSDLSERMTRRNELRSEVCSDLEQRYQDLISHREKGNPLNCWTSLENEVFPLDRIELSSLESSVISISRESVGEILDSSCMGCHFSDNMMGAPTHIPFGNMSDFDEFLKNSSSGQWGYPRIIVDRLSRPTSEHGSMPMGGGLEHDEREQVIIYINSFLEE